MSVYFRWNLGNTHENLLYLWSQWEHSERRFRCHCANSQFRMFHFDCFVLFFSMHCEYDI